jgi:hypothetical protein
MKTRSVRVCSWPWVIAETATVIAVAAVVVLARTTLGRSFAAAINADGYWVAATFAFELASIMTFARTQRIILRVPRPTTLAKTVHTNRSPSS